MNDEVVGKGPAEAAQRLESASESELQRLVAALELDAALARVEQRLPSGTPWYSNLRTEIWVAIIAAMVPLTGGVVTCVHADGQLTLERERFASDRTLELLRLALDERMPEAMRSRILDGLLAANGDPVIAGVAKNEKLRVDAQLESLADEKKIAEGQLQQVENKQKRAEAELAEAPQSPVAIRRVETLQRQYDDQRLRVQVIKYRLGEGSPPAPPEPVRVE